MATILALLTVTPGIQPDTATYLAFDPQRGVIYPLLLDLFRHAAPADSFLNWVARFQGACIATTAAFFALRIGHILNLDRAWRYFLFLLISLPGLFFAGNILTEPLLYAGVSLFWVCFLEYYLAPGIWRALSLAFFCALLVIFRPQLLPLAVFFGMIELWQFARRQQLIHVGTLVFLLVSLVAANTVQNHILVRLTGSSHIASTLGRHVLTNMLYVAHPEDAAMFSDSGQRTLFQKALQLAEEKGYTQRKWDKTASHIPMSINRIYTEAVVPLCSELARVSEGGEDSADGLALKMGLTLLNKRTPEYLNLLFRKVYDSQPLFYSLIAVLLALGLIHSNRTNTWQGRFMGLVVFGTAMGILPYLLLVTLDNRYVFPLEYPLLAWVAALGASLQRQEKLDNTAR
ncbi:MAG: hypothetical protein KKF77_14145 [Proteobacteria bacterium]|nr:hypothetical protein [Pseudomonadota bacterium]